MVPARLIRDKVSPCQGRQQQPKTPRWHPCLPPIRTAAVQARIGADTLLLDFAYALGPDLSRLYVMFLIGAEGPLQARDLGAGRDIDRDITDLTDVPGSKPHDEADRNQRALVVRRLAGKILQLDDSLPYHILVALIGLWGRVPFGLLLDAQGESRLSNATS